MLTKVVLSSISYYSVEVRTTVLTKVVLIKEVKEELRSFALYRLQTLLLTILLLVRVLAL